MKYRHSFEEGPAEIDEAMPAPLLMNCWKHHAGVVRRRIDEAVEGGEQGVRALPRQLLLIGEGLMDLYLGALSPRQIALETRTHLEQRGVARSRAFRLWLQAAEGYRTIELSDTSRWVLRESPLPDRPQHIHPARYSPLTVRARANLLKSAIATLAWAGLLGLEPLQVATVNEARRELLELSPIGKMSRRAGLGELLHLLLGVMYHRES
jgi:hypothetical protein